MANKDTIIRIQNLCNYLGDQWVHKDLNLEINRGQIIAIIGGSGSGKTTLLRNILMLLRPTSGQLNILDHDITEISSLEAKEIKRRWGVLFQQSALFSSLTVLGNVIFPMREFTTLKRRTAEKLGLLKIVMSGLNADAASKFPAELSGGMQKRAAMARAIALDPELLFLDEPTSGLDPHSSMAIDELIIHLRDSLGLTVFIVTHDINTLFRITDTVAFLGEGKVIANLPIRELMDHPHPLIQEYFAGSQKTTKLKS